ncbi:titin-like [Colossoma macropomum]|uniref:titin-like n=1 Tax=Colossoma macropomum TaxID=42526 RepID=UPI001864B928|nr:titin-like [Colossoma macropomum]
MIVTMNCHGSGFSVYLEGLQGCLCLIASQQCEQGQHGMDDKSIAVATVVAAVDQARSHQPHCDNIELSSAEATWSTEQFLSFQEQGGKRPGAVTAVLIPGDQGYSHGRMHAEGDRVEERFLEHELNQQVKLSVGQQAASKTMRTKAVHMPTATHATTTDHISQIQRTKEIASQVDTGLAPSPVPHFTVSKVTVPKPDHSHEVSMGGIKLSSNILQYT